MHSIYTTSIRRSAFGRIARVPALRSNPNSRRRNDDEKKASACSKKDATRSARPSPNKLANYASIVCFKPWLLLSFAEIFGWSLERSKKLAKSVHRNRNCVWSRAIPMLSFNTHVCSSVFCSAWRMLRPIKEFENHLVFTETSVFAPANKLKNLLVLQTAHNRRQNYRQLLVHPGCLVAVVKHEAHIYIYNSYGKWIPSGLSRSMDFKLKISLNFELFIAIRNCMRAC